MTPIPLALRHATMPRPTRQVDPAAVLVALSVLAVLLAVAEAAHPADPFTARLATVSGATIERATEVVGAIDRALAADPESAKAIPRARAALAVLAARESGLAEDVERCERRGDAGKAWGLWQVYGRKGEAACRGGLDAQALAGARHTAACARLWLTVQGTMRCYGTTHAEADKRTRLVETWPR